MIDYTQGKIYNVLNDQQQCLYVGHTTQTLKQRWNNHRYNREGWTIHLLESYPAKDRFDLETREERWRLRLQPRLNKKRCSNGIPYKRSDRAYNRCKRYKELYFPRTNCMCGRTVIARKLTQHQSTGLHRRTLINRTFARALYFRRHSMWRQICCRSPKRRQIEGLRGPSPCRSPSCAYIRQAFMQMLIEIMGIWLVFELLSLNGI